ncbi:MAG: T9SS type A sorting domain-containing protein [Saprospiraceae bacterium]|nr:T9SS type A sorting domain-containing protein [Saprospiraceae bacterium]
MNVYNIVKSTFFNLLVVCFFTNQLQAQTTITYETEIFTCNAIGEGFAQFSCPFNGTVRVEVVDVSPDIFFVFETSEVVDGAFSFEYHLFAVAPTNIQLIWVVETSDDVTGCALVGEEVNSTITTDCLCTPTFKSLITHESCFGCNDGIVELEVTGMIEPYTYEWSNGRTSAFEENLSPGMYLVTVTGSNMVECSGNVVVIVDPYECAQTTVQYESEHIDCFNECDGRIEIFGLSNGDDFQDILWEDGSTAIIREDLCAGLYLLDLVKADNCLYTADINIEEPELLELSIKEIIPANGNDGGSIIASVEGGVPPYSYFINQNGEAIDHDPLSNEFQNLLTGCYEIIVVDENVCTTFLDSVCVENSTSVKQLVTSAFKTYPNPCVDYIEITPEENYTIQSLYIYNTLGERKQKDKYSSRIDVSDLTPGLYTLEILTDEGFWAQSFVKTKN